MKEFSERSKKRMENLDTKLIYLLNYALATYSGDFTVLEGERSAARQQTLYQQGRTVNGKIVTNCDGIINKSKHQLNESGKATAVDLVPYPFTGWEDLDGFIDLGNHIVKTAEKMKIKLQWGGNWKNKDYPHFELI